MELDCICDEIFYACNCPIHDNEEKLNMEDATYCVTLDVQDFCPLCSVTQDLCEAFALLLTKENGNPRAHVIATEHGEAIVKAWTRIATQLDHPAIGAVMLTFNQSFIVVSEEPHA